MLGWVVDRFGSPVMIRFGVVIMGLGLCGLSQVDTLSGFYACAVVMAIGTSFCGYFPLSVALVQWFERQRARALSIMSSGLALGGLAVPLVAWVMQTWGWRTAALASGLVAILLGLPLARVMVRRPQDLGLQVDGESRPPLALNRSDGAPRLSEPQRREFTARQALRTQAFWYLAADHGLALVVVTAVNVHAITHMNQGLGYTVEQGGPVWATWVAVAGAVVAFAIGLRQRRSRTVTAAVASCLLLLPTVVHGFAHWTTSPARPASPLTPGLVQALRDVVPTGAIVYADPETSFRVAAEAALLVCVAPPGHVADTSRNRPYERRDRWWAFERTGDLAIPRACGARWLLVDGARSGLRPALTVAYRDPRYTLYRLGA